MKMENSRGVQKSAATQVDLQLTHTAMWCVATAGLSQITCFRKIFSFCYIQWIDSKPLRKSEFWETMIGWTLSISILSCLNNTTMWQDLFLKFFPSITHMETLMLPPSSERLIVADRISGCKRSQRKMALLESYINSEANLKNPNFVL